ncbi:hypothetical protein PTSG_11693 [Salpingoeca rosetta]|uniref:Uncharacterized protein n=1 Tax=Salpingoeca rosetta (strain ATCC 50818 / BSB-021) TaxID=946362 RepID=F2U163_SALR5|nr:uncharacterized protein PTSG_11693 [Salpingoeca rosetta]EGD80637.1 hypothetical protein PTSG_11693 [Salpingoeca rosetta]|eukprot:XP_004997198.1 hypothetical protein PTSG_11693 [Salpingoeca rosetta]
MMMMMMRIGMVMRAPATAVLAVSRCVRRAPMVPSGGGAGAGRICRRQLCHHQQLRRGAMLLSAPQSSRRAGERLGVALLTHTRRQLAQKTPKPSAPPSIPASARPSTSSSPAGPMRLVTWYTTMLKKHPLPTKTVTAAIIGLCGDLLAQNIQGSFPLDWVRTTKFVLLQAAFVAPILHIWYNVLARAVKGRGVMLMVRKLALDQFMFAPAFIPIFLAVLLLVEGRADDIAREVKQETPRTILRNWQLWVPAQCINFLFIPVHLQVLFSNMVGLLWNTYLSLVAHHTPDDGLEL